VQGVLFYKVRIKKIPRQKDSKIRVPTQKSDEAYYILEKKVNLGDYGLSGDTVFNQNDVVVVQLQLPQFWVPLRLLAKITHTTSFMEYKRVVFQGDLHFSAVHKGDFDHLLELDDRRRATQKR
jgi:hypothetical protein